MEEAEGDWERLSCVATADKPDSFALLVGPSSIEISKNQALRRALSRLVASLSGCGRSRDAMPCAGVARSGCWNLLERWNKLLH